MSKKIGIWAIFVIVLVSLSWFKVVKAQDLKELSSEERARLMEEYRKRQGKETEADRYKTPQIYDKSESSQKIFGPLTKNEMLEADSLRLPEEDVANLEDTLSITPFEELKPFGSELFNGPRETDPPVDIASASDYILGPGDNVILYLWGRVEREYNLTVDREGKVFIPRVGEIIGWGLSLDQFTNKAKKQLTSVYSDFELTVSLGKIRSIRVFVTGEVNNPGSYTVSSLASMLNVIYAAGGPNDRGSMRSIQLMRGGKEVSEIDLYEFLLKGNNSADVRLRTNDVIFVPVAGPKVAIRGEIKREGIYELKGSQTAVQLLGLAGSPTPAAHLERVMLERIAGKKEWEVIDLNLDTTKTTLSSTEAALMDGDRLTVYSIFDARTNMVALFGKVQHSGYFERNDSTRVSDLISQGKLQPYDVYLERANLYRRYPDGSMQVLPIDLNAALAGKGDNILLRDKDSLHVYDIQEIEWEKLVYIEGEVKNPGPYPLYDNMTITDLVFLAGSFTRGAYMHRAEIARIDPAGEVTLMNVKLDGSESSFTVLAEDDHIYVRRLPEWEKDRTVVIEGEVMYPGKYTMASRRETLYQLLQRAGGFTSTAFPRGAIFNRSSIRSNLDQLGVKGLLERSAVIVEDSLGQQKRQDHFEFDLSSMNRIIIDLEKIISSNGLDGDVVLQPDDHIIIPSIPTGISVMGAVGANGTFHFKEHKSVKDYINRAGSFNKQADKKGTRLIRADGEVYSNGGTLKQRVMLGDVIVVPTKIEKERSWLKTLTTALSATTGVLTSIYIVSKL